MWYEVLRPSLFSAHCASFMSRRPLLRGHLDSLFDILCVHASHKYVVMHASFWSNVNRFLSILRYQSLYREIFFRILLTQTKITLYVTFSDRFGILFGYKSIGKWWIQSYSGWFNRNQKSISQCVRRSRAISTSTRLASLGIMETQLQTQLTQLEGIRTFIRRQIFRHRIFRNKFSDTKFSETNFPTPNFPTSNFPTTTFSDIKFSDYYIFRQHFPTDKFSNRNFFPKVVIYFKH